MWAALFSPRESRVCKEEWIESDLQIIKLKWEEEAQSVKLMSGSRCTKQYQAVPEAKRSARKNRHVLNWPLTSGERLGGVSLEEGPSKGLGT